MFNPYSFYKDVIAAGSYLFYGSSGTPVASYLNTFFAASPPLALADQTSDSGHTHTQIAGAHTINPSGVVSTAGAADAVLVNGFDEPDMQSIGTFEVFAGYDTQIFFRCDAAGQNGWLARIRTPTAVAVVRLLSLTAGAFTLEANTDFTAPADGSHTCTVTATGDDLKAQIDAGASVVFSSTKHNTLGLIGLRLQTKMTKFEAGAI